MIRNRNRVQVNLFESGDEKEQLVSRNNTNRNAKNKNIQNQANKHPKSTLDNQNRQDKKLASSNAKGYSPETNRKNTPTLSNCEKIPSPTLRRTQTNPTPHINTSNDDDFIPFNEIDISSLFVPNTPIGNNFISTRNDIINNDCSKEEEISKVEQLKPDLNLFKSRDPPSLLTLKNENVSLSQDNNSNEIIKVLNAELTKHQEEIISLRNYLSSCEEKLKTNSADFQLQISELESALKLESQESKILYETILNYSKVKCSGATSLSNIHNSFEVSNTSLTSLDYSEDDKMLKVDEVFLNAMLNKKTSSESASLIAKCSHSFKEEIFQLKSELEAANELIKYLQEKETISEAVGKSQNNQILQLQNEIKYLCNEHNLISLYGKKSSCNNGDFESFFSLDDENASNLITNKHDNKLFELQLQLNQAKVEISILLKQKEELASEYRLEQKSLRDQAVNLQELLTLERQELRNSRDENRKQNQNLEDIANFIKSTKNVSNDKIAFSIGTNTDISLSEIHQNNESFIELEQKLKRTVTSLKDKEVEVSTRKKACETLRKECEALHKVHESNKKIIKSLQNDSDKYKRELALVQAKFTEMNNQCKKYSDENFGLREALHNSKNEASNLLNELKRVSQAVSSTQCKLDSSNESLRKIKIQYEKLLEQHYDNKLEKCSNHDSHSQKHLINDREGLFSPSLKNRKTNDFSKYIRASSDTNSSFSSHRSASLSNMSDYVGIGEAGLMMDRQSLISLLSLDEERTSSLSNDYLLECWQSEHDDRNIRSKKEAPLEMDQLTTSSTSSQSLTYSSQASNSSNTENMSSELPLQKDSYEESGGDLLSLSTASVSSNVTQVADLKHLPTWVNDIFVKYCKSCSLEFNIINRKHHCRCCGNIYCHACSSKKISLPHFNITEKVRVCNNCHLESKKLNESYSITNNLSS